MSTIPCPHCQGKGERLDPVRLVLAVCQSCRGSGRVVADAAVMETGR